MGPIANSVMTRGVLVVLGVGVAVILLLAAALVTPAGRERRELYFLPLPSQSAAIVEVLDATPPALRPRLLDALNSRALKVEIVAGPPPPPPPPAPRRWRPRSQTPSLEQVMRRYDKVFAEHEIHLVVRRPPLLARVFGAGRGGWEPTQLYVRLHDGTFVMIEPARAILFDGFLARAMLAIGLSGLLVIAGLLLAVRQTSRPVALLAANARTFAARLDAADLPETGAPALRDLSTAFNQMKGQIRSLLEERTRSLAAIAHDLRTYLTRLRLRAEFITDPEQRLRAERDIGEMSALVDDALLFARTASGVKATGSATCDLVELTCAEVAVRQELDQAVAFASPAVAVQARVESLAFKRILANLVDNAVRYGGTARVALAVEAGDAVLRVEDDGPGVPETDLQRMIAPFERLESSRGREGGGAGLGLAIVRALVEANSGTFALHNRAGGGLVAEARLPRA